MKTIVVRYQARPDRADENQGLIENVFAELEQVDPQGFTYSVYRLEDGVSFIHIVNETDDDSPTSLQDIDAFRAFTANIADRCAVQPVVTEATLIGAHFPGFV